MKYFIYILVFIFFGNFVFSQENQEINDLLLNAEENVYSNPEESIRIAKQILRNSNTVTMVTQTNLILSKSSYAKGNLEEAIAYFFDGKKDYVRLNDESLQFKYCLFGSTLFNHLGFYELSKNLKEEAKSLSETNSNQLFAKLLDIQSQWFHADSIQNSNDLKRLLSEFEHFKKSKNKEANHLNSMILYSLAKINLVEKKNDSAKMYFEQALKKQRTFVTNSLQEAFILASYSNYFYEMGKYQTAKDTLEKTLQISKAFNNPFLDYVIFSELSKNQIALSKEENFIESNSKATQALKLIESKERAASNLIFNVLNQNHSTSKEMLSKKFVSTNWTFGVIGALLLVILLFVRWFTVFKLKHTKDVINYLKLIEGLDKKESSPAKSALKGIAIPQETENALLKKLETFERSNKFTSKEMSLAQMASQFETNTKYLSEVINKHKGKNFNLYINHLRINYIVKKLKTETNYLNYKVSYLAEESGFSSHSSFATVFKNITGISPNVFIELLKKDLNRTKKINEHSL